MRVTLMFAAILCTMLLWGCGSGGGGGSSVGSSGSPASSTTSSSSPPVANMTEVPNAHPSVVPQVGVAHLVMTSTNDNAGNRVLVFARAADGTLALETSVPTGGLGAIAGLEDQGAIAYDPVTSLLFVCNAGDNTVSLMQVSADRSVSLLSRVSSGGVEPVSIAFFGSLAYVVNNGDGGTPANISGFRVQSGTLVPLAGSSQPLSVANPGPAQISFTPDGSWLVVTEKQGQAISVYGVGGTGLAGPPNSQPSAGNLPFGFAFSADGHLLVTEAVSGSTSSYAIGADGNLRSITSALKNGQSAACWAAVTGNVLYVTNTGSDSISSYLVRRSGAITVLDGVAATTSDHPFDVAITPDGEFLYTLDKGPLVLSAFRVNIDGTLESIGVVATGLPGGTAGLVAR